MKELKQKFNNLFHTCKWLFSQSCNINERINDEIYKDVVLGYMEQTVLIIKRQINLK